MSLVVIYNHRGTVRTISTLVLRGFSQRTYRSNVYKTEAEAEAAFRRQRNYLLRPGGWNNNSPGLSYADAPNWSHHGKEGKNQPVQAGDVLKIEAPMKSDYFVGIERVTDMNAVAKGYGYAVDVALFVVSRPKWQQ